MPFRGHHVWCNQMGNKSPEECEQCKLLNKRAPENGLTQEEMLKKYHPDAISRGTSKHA